MGGNSHFAFHTSLDWPEARPDYKNVLWYPSRHMLSQHLYLHALEWVPRVSKVAKNPDVAKTTIKLHKLHERLSHSSTETLCSRDPKTLFRLKITSQRLLDTSQAGVYRGKRHPPPPHFGPFWAYSRTLPQGVELLV